jgi:hypothetical protein
MSKQQSMSFLPSPTSHSRQGSDGGREKTFSSNPNSGHSTPAGGVSRNASSRRTGGSDIVLSTVTKPPQQRSSSRPGSRIGDSNTRQSYAAHLLESQQQHRANANASNESTNTNTANSNSNNNNNNTTANPTMSNASLVAITRQVQLLQSRLLQWCYVNAQSLKSFEAREANAEVCMAFCCNFASR